MVTISCLLIGSFLILQTHGTSVRPGGPLCKVNEEHSDCYGHCQATCSVAVPRCTRDCNPGCICRSGFIREFDNGECVKKEKCLGCNGDPNAENGCDTCNTNCDNYGVEPKMCSKRPCRIDECKCRDGFVRNSKGLCIPYKKCRKCPRNEEYNCVIPCPPRTCSSRPINYLCIQNQKCVNKCDCKDGFLRNTKGICVAFNDCDKKKKCPINEEYNCVKPCPPRTCFARRARYLCAPNQQCVDKCDCKNGFLRNTKGICVAIDNCDKEIGQPKCPINQEYKCVKPCPPKKCLPRWGLIRYSCPPNQKCINKCDCVEGFLKNGQGTCIPSNQCYTQTPSCGQNEVHSPCGGRCQKTCKNKNPRCPFICIPGCICRPNYVRDDKTNKCIKETQCKVKCPVNEEFKCVNPCPPNLCSSRPELIKCGRDQICVHKCDCKAGYLRNKRGKCVTKNQCQKPKCGKNEVYARHRTCPPKTCRSLVEKKRCLPGPKKCTKKCDCKTNYLRNNCGICIPSNQCFPKYNKPVVTQSKPNPDKAAPSSEPDKRRSSQPDNDTADDNNNDGDEVNEPGNDAPSSNPDDRSQPDEDNDPPPQDEDNNDDEDPDNGALPAKNDDKYDEGDENEDNEDEGDNEKENHLSTDGEKLETTF